MIYPIMSYQAGNEGGSKNECRKDSCALWSTRYEKCSITVLAEKDIVPTVVQTEIKEKISY
jgi:hypothetical protein